MLVVALFSTLSVLFIVATPLPANRWPSTVDSDLCSTLYRRAPPRFEIPYNRVTERHRKDTVEKMKKHYETESTDEQRRAGLASVISRWKDLQSGREPGRESGREYLGFNYHTGDTTESPVIPPTAIIYRDKPAPKTHFLNVPKEHREEMELEIAKRYNDLNPDSARRVRSTKVWRDWHLNGGIREKTKFTFHSSVTNTINNIIGEPTTITRPLTLQFPELPSWDKLSIDHEVHAAHRKMVADPQHPATTSNYGTVHSNWHDSLPDANGKTHKQVIVGLEEVSENETGRQHLGNYAVRAGTGDFELIGPNAGGPSSHTAAGTSHAEPSQVNNEVARPMNSQEQQHINIDSSPESSRTLSSNSVSLHLKSQGSQFDAGGPSSHSGSSHPELLHAGLPQQPLQAHTGSRPLRSGLNSDQLWHADSPRFQSPPQNSQMLPYPNSPPSQFRANNPGPSSRHGPSHPELLHVGSPQQLLQPAGSPPLHDEYYIPPESRPLRDIWQTLHAHPSLFNDPIWHDDLLHPQFPPSINQIPPHASSSSLQLGVGDPSTSSRPGPLQPVLPQQSLQFHTGNQPVHNEFYMQWRPESHPSQGTWHPSLRSGQLSHADSSHPESPPSNLQILSRPNSPPLHPDAWLPGPPSQPPPPQVGLSSNPSESTHPDADLSPEVWHLLNPDPVYPYPWNPHLHNP